MANNYQQFSELLTDLTPAEKQWLMEVLDQPEPAILKTAGINLRHIDIDDWPGFGWDLVNDNANLWIYGEECGNVDHAGELVRALLARHRPDACLTLTWSESCSALRYSEFGGGGLFITAKSIKVYRAADMVDRMRHRFQRRQTNG